MTTAPQFNLVYPGLLQEIVDVATEHSEASPAAVAANTLARLCAMVGHHCRFPIGDGCINARPFLLLIGQSSRARKGTSETTVKRIFQRLLEVQPKNERLISPTAELTGLSTGEGLVHSVRDPSSELNEDGLPSDPGVWDKRLLVIEPEFGNVLGKLHRSNSLSAYLRNAWDGKDLAVSTRTRPMKATEPHIVVLGHITAAEFLENITSTSLHNGFLNRFLCLHVERGSIVPIPVPTPQKQLDSLARKLLAVVRWCNTDRVFVLSQEARELWHEIYPKLTEERPGHAEALLARSEAHALQLAMIFSMLDCSTEISVANLTSALTWVAYARATAEYLLESTKFAIGGLKNLNCATKVLALLSRVSSATKMDIYQQFSGHVTKDELDGAISHLLSQDPPAIVQKSEKTGGRPRIILMLNKSADPAQCMEREVSEESLS